MKKSKNILPRDNMKNIHTSKEIRNDIQNTLNNITERNPVKLRDYTPKILVQNGIKDLPMYENPSHIRKNILTPKEAIERGLVINSRDHYHGLGEDIYIKVIDSLDNPRVIFKNNNNKDYLILTIIKDRYNNNIVVPIEIETTTYINRVKIDINRIKSVYGYKKVNNISLNDYIKYNIKNNNFTKIYEQKKERGTGFSTAAGSSYVDNISQYNQNVKLDISSINNIIPKNNINTYDYNKLIKIKGIGKTKATAIIEYRKANSNFNNIEEIKNVPGIGESLFEKIKAYITV